MTHDLHPLPTISTCPPSTSPPVSAAKCPSPSFSPWRGSMDGPSRTWCGKPGAATVVASVALTWGECSLRVRLTLRSCWQT